MSRAFKVTKEFVLYRLVEEGPQDQKFTELEKRLPAEVELNQAFVDKHMLHMDWIMAMERLLEGEHLRRALDREDEAAEVLRLAIRKASEEFQAKPLTAAGSAAHEKLIDELWAVYSRAQAAAFIEEAKLQGGWDIRDAQENSRVKP